MVQELDCADNWRGWGGVGLGQGGAGRSGWGTTVQVVSLLAKIDFMHFADIGTEGGNANVTSKVKNKKGSCLPDSRGILATMYINNGA